MTKKLGRNRNTNDAATTTTVAINSVTAKTIAGSNSNRIFFSVALESTTSDVDVVIRLYPAATDNIAQGVITLTRKTFGNDSLFFPYWAMPDDNIYTGEISAITLLGTFNLLITEY